MNPLVKRFKDHIRNKRDPVTIGRTDGPVGMYSSMILSENISMQKIPAILSGFILVGRVKLSMSVSLIILIESLYPKESILF